MNQPTREKTTELSYQKRALGRLVNFLHDTGLDWDWNQDALIEWLTCYRDTLSAASWRQSRAALVWYMKEKEDDLMLAGRIKGISTEGCPKATKTSSQKKKTLSEEDFKAMSGFLLESHYKHLKNKGEPDSSTSLQALHFLTATELTGLRPSEWYGCQMFVESSKGEPEEGVLSWASRYSDPETGELHTEGLPDIDILKLVVKNGKASNGRAHGEYRTLRFREISKETLFALVGQIRFTQKHPTQEAFNTYLKSCQDKITYTTKKLWPTKSKRPTLYSGRHQFSANLKLTESLPVIAALMGHGSDRTATEHYGKKRYGRGSGIEIEASSEEVERIRRTAKTGFTGGKDKLPEPAQNI